MKRMLFCCSLSFSTPDRQHAPVTSNAAYHRRKNQRNHILSPVCNWTPPPPPPPNPLRKIHANKPLPLPGMAATCNVDPPFRFQRTSVKLMQAYCQNNQISNHFLLWVLLLLCFPWAAGRTWEQMKEERSLLHPALFSMSSRTNQRTDEGREKSTASCFVFHEQQD